MGNICSDEQLVKGSIVSEVLVVEMFSVLILFTKVVAFVAVMCIAGSSYKSYSYSDEDGVSTNCSAGSRCSSKQSIVVAEGMVGLAETVVLVVVVALKSL